LAPNAYDVTVRGRVLTISNATVDQNKDLDARVLAGVQDLANPASATGLRTAGTASVVAQLVFTAANWSAPQTVALMAIDDKVIDGGDALVFPAFEDR